MSKPTYCLHKLQEVLADFLEIDVKTLPNIADNLKKAGYIGVDKNGEISYFYTPKSKAFHNTNIAPRGGDASSTYSSGKLDENLDSAQPKADTHDSTINTPKEQGNPLPEFGENYPQYYHNGAGAIEKLLETKGGQVAGAFHKEELGDIDLVWGDSSFGLQHILERRGAEIGEQKAIELIRQIPQILQDSKIYKEADNKIELITDKYTIVLGKREDKKFVVSTLRDRRNEKRLETIQTRVADDFTDETLANKPLSPNQQADSTTTLSPFARALQEKNNKIAKEEAQLKAEQAKETQKRAEYNQKIEELDRQKQSLAGLVANKRTLERGQEIDQESIGVDANLVIDEDNIIALEYVRVKAQDLAPNFENTQLQPRTEQNQKLIKEIAENFKPELMIGVGGFRDLPIITQWGAVVVGNHRLEGMLHFTPQSRTTYEQTIKETYGIELAPDEMLVRIPKEDLSDEQLVNLAYASNAETTHNIGDRVFAALGKYDKNLENLPQHIQSDSLDTLTLQVARIAQPHIKSPDEFGANLALLAKLAKNSNGKNIAQALNHIQNTLDPTQYKALQNMFVNTAGAWHNLVNDLGEGGVKNLELRPYLLDTITATASMLGKSRAENFSKLARDIEYLLHTTDENGTNAMVAMNKESYKNIISDLLGASLARFVRLENPSNSLYEVLKNAKSDLEEMVTPSLLSAGKPLSEVDVYDFIELLISKGEASEATSKVVDLLPALREKERAFNAKISSGDSPKPQIKENENGNNTRNNLDFSRSSVSSDSLENKRILDNARVASVERNTSRTQSGERAEHRAQTQDRDIANANQNTQRETRKDIKEITFKDSKGKEHTLTKETQEQWLKTFELESLEQSYMPKHSEEIKEVLGGKEIKLQKGSLLKLVSQGREQYIPQIKAVLDEPEAILRDSDNSYLFVKHLKDEDYFVNVSVDKGEYAVSISNGIKESNNLKNKLENGASVLYQSPNASSNLQTLLQTSRYSANEIDKADSTTKTPLDSREIISDIQRKIAGLQKSTLQEKSAKDPLKWEGYAKAINDKTLTYKQVWEDMRADNPLFDIAYGNTHTLKRGKAQEIITDLTIPSKLQDNANRFIQRFLQQALKSYEILKRTPIGASRADMYRIFGKAGVDLFSISAKQPIPPALQARQALEFLYDIKPLKEFGTNYAEGYHDGAWSIQKLLDTKEGQVAGAFEKEGLGDIDLVWGDSSFGLAHILERRTQDFIEQGLSKEEAQKQALEFVKQIPEIIQKGKVELGKNRAFIDFDNKRSLIALDYKGEDRKWLITAYKEYDAPTPANPHQSERNIDTSSVNRADDIKADSTTDSLKMQSNAHIGSGMLGGSVAGVETDENGNIVGFDPEKFALGFLGGAGGSVALSKGFRFLKDNPQYKEALKKELADTLSKGWEATTKQYPILETIARPNYIVQNEKGRLAQANNLLNKLEKQEVRGIHNVTYNGKNATIIRQDLERIDNAIAYKKGYHDNTKDKGKGAIHIKEHLEPYSEGYTTNKELLSLGKNIREYLKKYQEPHIDNNGARIYEWFNNKGDCFRVVVDSRGSRHSNASPSPSDEIITYFSDRFSTKWKGFLNPNVQKDYESTIPQYTRDLKEWHRNSHKETKNEDGSPKIFYHGSSMDKNIEVFEPLKHSMSEQGLEHLKGVYFSDKKGVAKTYIRYGGGMFEAFLKVKNPYIIDFEGKSFNDGIDSALDELSGIANFRNTYDGILFKNIRDSNSQSGRGGYLGDTLMVFDSKQIKHIDNKGSYTDINGNITSTKPKDTEAEHRYFNEDSPNIYQSNPHIGAGLVSGTLAGVETDENGNIIGFDPSKFALGFLGGAGGSVAVSKGFKLLKEKPELKEALKRELADTLAKGWESTTKQYPILKALEPMKIMQSQKGRIAQAGNILNKLQETFLQNNLINEKALNAHATKLPKPLSKEEFLAQITDKDTKGYSTIQTPIGQIQVNLAHAWKHINKGNTYKKDRSKYSGAFLDTLTDPLFIVKQEYIANPKLSANAREMQNSKLVQANNDEIIAQDSYVFFKPYHTQSGFNYMIGYALDIEGNIINTTFIPMGKKDFGRIKKILKSEVLYYKDTNAN